MRLEKNQNATQILHASGKISALKMLAHDGIELLCSQR